MAAVGNEADAVGSRASYSTGTSGTSSPARVPGVVEGLARSVTDPEGARPEQGNILVVPYADQG